MTSFIAAGGSGRSTSVIPAVPAASSVTRIAFIWTPLCISPRLHDIFGSPISGARNLGVFTGNESALDRMGCSAGDPCELAYPRSLSPRRRRGRHRCLAHPTPRRHGHRPDPEYIAAIVIMALWLLADLGR